jgi:peptidoglycan/LPS O-acetylase OafA/YrhL
MKRMLSLNMLRGLAALLIVVHHANSDVIPDLPDLSGAAAFLLWRIRNLGWSGIDLFFVLGAFFMAGSMFADLNDRGHISLGRYWMRRAIRIVPSYYVLLLVLAVTGATGYIDFSDAFSSIKDIMTHFCFLNNYMDQLPNGPTWYLAAMVQVYIMVPFLLSLLNRVHRIRITAGFWFRVTIVVVCLDLALRIFHVANGTHLPNDFMLTHFRLDTICIGMLAMALYRERHPLLTRMSRHPWVWIGLALLLISPALFFPRRNPFMFTAGFTLLACGYSIIIVLIANESVILTIKGVTILSLVSAWSYNIYLWHCFLPALLGTPYLCLQQYIHSVTSSINAMAFLQILLFVLISIGAGYLATALVERPAARFLSGRTGR